MKIRKKLFLGFGLLFVIVLVFGAVSLYYIEVISETSNVTLKNNYNTLTYTREMRSVLDENDLPLTPVITERFDISLKKQENNITEHGEKETTADLRKAFSQLADPSQSLAQKQQTERAMRSLLKKIEGLNMQAIVLKNDYTHSTVNKATLYLGGMTLITFLILFILIANFPALIVNPLNELTEGFQEISQKNYDFRIGPKTTSEFAQLAQAFNTMAEKLAVHDDADATKSILAELRTKLLIEDLSEAIIGVNEKQEILFINNSAKKILNLPNDHRIIGRSIKEFIKDNSILKTIVENEDMDNPIRIDTDGKTSYFQQKNLEIVAPNLRPDIFDPVQIAGFSAGWIYILKDVTEAREHV